MNDLINVAGHSGCEIKAVREDGKLFIYKSTHDPKYFKRLVLQAEKQQHASLNKMQFIRIPEIHSILESETEVRIKMDYIYSRNFVEFFEHAGFEQVNYLIGAFIMFLEKEIEDSRMFDMSSEIIINKFEDVYDKTLNNIFLQTKEFKTRVKDILDKSKSVFEQLPEYLNIPIGVCHGDLTFSNILFNGNNYYLIDFLDSFIESPLLDIVKLRQDTAWQWSRLMFNGNCDNIRLKIAFQKVDRELDKHFESKYQWYRDYYQTMQIMNFLRILQYAHDKNVTDFLLSALSKQLSSYNI